MRTGRPREPAQSKVLAGTFRPDRQAHGPVVPMGLPIPPAYLNDAAREIWQTLGVQLASNGLLSEVDRHSFAAFCDTAARFEAVCAQLDSLESMIDRTPNGFEMQSALFLVRSRLFDQLMRSGQTFGTSPAARSAMKNAAEQLALPLEGWETI